MALRGELPGQEDRLGRLPRLLGDPRVQGQVGAAADQQKRDFCTAFAAHEHWSVRTLLAKIARPYLLDTARSDSDASVRKTAREAVIALSSSEHAADRAIAGQPPAGAPPGSTLRGQVAAVIALFNEFAAVRETPSSTLDESSVLYAVIDYLGAWGGRSTQDLDEVGLAGAMAVGAICRFVEIPDEEADTKFTSFQDAKERVADYESVLASRVL